MSRIRPDLDTIVRTGPAAWLDGTRERLGQLPAIPPRPDAARGEAEPGEPKLGMCGLLRPVHVTGKV